MDIFKEKISMGSKENFEQLFAEARGEEISPVAPKKAAPLRELPKSSDALSLSLQGKKALGRKKAANEASKPKDFERIKSVDWQGNSSRISTQAKALAQEVEEDVAWETRLKPKNS